MKNVAHESEKSISGAIKVDEKEVGRHLDALVRQSVEETLNALLNAEADAICKAGRYAARSGSTPEPEVTSAGC